MCICKYVIPIHMYWICAHVCGHTCMNICTRIRIYMYVYIHTYKHTHIAVHVDIHKEIHMSFVYTHVFCVYTSNVPPTSLFTRPADEQAHLLTQDNTLEASPHL
jgi:hypothetical protein